MAVAAAVKRKDGILPVFFFSSARASKYCDIIIVGTKIKKLGG